MKFKKMHLKMANTRCRPFRSDILNKGIVENGSFKLAKDTAYFLVYCWYFLETKHDVVQEWSNLYWLLVLWSSLINLAMLHD